MATSIDLNPGSFNEFVNNSPDIAPDQQVAAHADAITTYREFLAGVEGPNDPLRDAKLENLHRTYGRNVLSSIAA